MSTHTIAICRRNPPMRVARLASLFAIAAAAACLPPRPVKPPHPRPLPADTFVYLNGHFAFSTAGALTMELVEPCWMVVDGRTVRCHGSAFGDAPLQATTPWGDHVAATWIDATHLEFRVDWKTTGLDPLVGRAGATAKRAWMIRELRWTPTDGEAQRMLDLVAEATDTQADVVSGGPPPDLQIMGFEVNGGILQAGGTADLMVRIANHGPGTAYRVIATVRSGILSLHGQRVGFGRIRPGAEKLRRLPLTLPISETSPDTMLVVAFDEGNGFSPPSVSLRLPIAAPAIAPSLAMRCWIPGRNEIRPALDAGEEVVVRCLVHNVGTGTANVDLEASIAGSAPTRSTARPVAPGQHATFDLRVTIPRNLAVDAAVPLVMIVRDRAFARSAQATVTGGIRKPKLCEVGQLTHMTYHAKLVELQAAKAAGDLTQEQFDHYDAELVNCLNDTP